MRSRTIAQVRSGPSSGVLLALLALAACAPAAGVRVVASPLAAEYDLVVRNGRVLDGAGNPWIAADVAIRAGRIARVGHVLRGPGRLGTAAATAALPTGASR
jgi:hypothetical protein